MILQKLADATRQRISRDQLTVPQNEMEQLAREMPADQTYPFAAALQKPGISLICEVKKASPSKGVLREDFPYIEIAHTYAQAGADAISVLTEPDYFQGADRYLTEIRRAVSLPLLRKDFILSPYQIDQAKVLGADAILLICALLTPQQLSAYIQQAHALGLTALVETHTKDEVQMAINSGAKVIGINNRNLQDFSVSLETSLELLSRMPSHVVKVSESGIATPEDVRRLIQAGADAILIGESVVTAACPKDVIARMKGALS